MSMRHVYGLTASRMEKQAAFKDNLRGYFAEVSGMTKQQSENPQYTAGSRAVSDKAYLDARRAAAEASVKPYHPSFGEILTQTGQVTAKNFKVKPQLSDWALRAPDMERRAQRSVDLQRHLNQVQGASIGSPNYTIPSLTNQQGMTKQQSYQPEAPAGYRVLERVMMSKMAARCCGSAEEECDEKGCGKGKPCGKCEDKPKNAGCKSAMGKSCMTGADKVREMIANAACGRKKGVKKCSGWTYAQARRDMLNEP